MVIYTNSITMTEQAFFETYSELLDCLIRRNIDTLCQRCALGCGHEICNLTTGDILMAIGPEVIMSKCRSCDKYSTWKKFTATARENTPWYIPVKTDKYAVPEIMVQRKLREFCDYMNTKFVVPANDFALNYGMF